jgi:5-methylcytosine-specific restriction endonuclease McrA
VFFAHTKRVTPSYTPEDLVSLWKNQEGKCPITGSVLVPGENAALDHIVPINRDGDGTINNVRFIHMTVNRIKWNMTDAEFKVLICDFLPLLTPWGKRP